MFPATTFHFLGVDASVATPFPHCELCLAQNICRLFGVLRELLGLNHVKMAVKSSSFDLWFVPPMCVFVTEVLRVEFVATHHARSPTLDICPVHFSFSWH